MQTYYAEMNLAKDIKLTPTTRERLRTIQVLLISSPFLLLQSPLRVPHLFYRIFALISSLNPRPLQGQGTVDHRDPSPRVDKRRAHLLTRTRIVT